MSRQDILDKMTEIFRDLFDDESLELTEETSSSDVDGWDSLMNISIISTIEEEFDISFSIKDAAGLKTIGEIMDKIETKL